jgi:hypothetical protein
MFLGFFFKKTYLKMKKPSKKKILASNWEGPFIFVEYLNENGYMDQDERSEMNVVKGKEEQLWDRPRRNM